MKKKMCVIMILVLIAGNLTGCADRSKQTVPAGKNSIKGTIRIYTFQSNRFLEEAAQKFESRNPGVKVEIDTCFTIEMLKQGNPIALLEKYINTINTELMSGKGADIIPVNGMPYKKYIYRHMFVDLNQLMKSDPNYDASEYYTNIFDAVEINNGLYTLPVDYCFEYLGSEARINANDRLWNWQEFFNAAQNALNEDPVTGGRYILLDSTEGLFRTIFRQDYRHFVNEERKTASFNSQEFINLLKQCKRLADKNQIAKSADKISDEGSEDGISEKTRQQALFQYHVISSMSYLASYLASSQVNLYRLPSNDKGSNHFNSTMYAINNASPNKTAAWEFLKFLISDEMQTSPYTTFPVNKSAFKEICAIETKRFCQDKSIRLSRDKKIELMQKSASIFTIDNDRMMYDYLDGTIQAMVMTEAHSFFVGEASAEDAARVIQQKVNIYLKE